MDIKISMHTGGMAQTNGYLLQRGEQAIMIDAPLGACAWLESLGILPTDLLLTHQHYDHIEDAAKLSKAGTNIHAFADYSSELTLETFLEAAGMPVNLTPYRVDNLLKGKSEITIDDWTLQIEHVPGHAADSLVFITENLVFAGDTLFAGSIGRADLPGGDMELLVSGIREKLLSLDADARVFPGHGPDTTVGTEAASNPFVRTPA